LRPERPHLGSSIPNSLILEAIFVIFNPDPIIIQTNFSAKLSIAQELAISKQLKKGASQQSNAPLTMLTA